MNDKSAKEKLGGTRPREGISAKFCKEGMYKEEIQSLCWERSRVMHRKIRFCSALHDLPPCIACITP